jgi:hypothetical protein
MKVNRMEDKKELEKICEIEGHNFESYAIHLGNPYDNYIEQAGECKRCGFDTHQN